MGMEVESAPTRSRRTVLLAIAASLLLVLFVAGLAFSNSIGAARVTANARALHWTNAAIGTSALARAGLVQAVTFLDLEDHGLATPDDVEFAMEQVATAHEELEELTAAGEGRPSLPGLEGFVSMVEETREALERGDLDEARNLLVGDVESSYI